MTTARPCRTSTVNQTSETALIAALRAGEEQAFEQLVREHGGRMLAVARRFLGCEHEAGDAVQEAFLSAFRSIESFAGESRLGTWLHRIVVNVCLMRLRAARSRPAVSIDALLPVFEEDGHHARPISAWNAAPSEPVEVDETRARVRACIQELPEPYRVVLLLRDIEELDTAETAKRMGISQAAVKVRLHRARQALRTLLDPYMRSEADDCN